MLKSFSHHQTFELMVEQKKVGNFGNN